MLTLLLGFPTAYFIATGRERTRDVWLFLITIPFWTNLLDPHLRHHEIIRNEGIINTLLIWLGVIDTPIQMLFTDVAILLGMVYVYLPLMVLPLYASMESSISAWSRRATTSMRRASRCCGASSFRWSSRASSPARILVFIPALGAYVTPQRARRRQEHDDRQPDRAAVRPGPQLAARRGAVDRRCW